MVYLMTFLLWSLCLLSPASSSGEQTLFFNPQGYRIDRFRSPVPEFLQGADILTTGELKQLLETKSEKPPVLIDVLPTPPKPEGLADTALWLPPTRYNIPGSAWLPNVGYGQLSDTLEDYFRDNLNRLTQGDKRWPLVIYCQADCWMSWNAARRATEYGYSQVFWYPDGTDGWEGDGLPLAISEPVPMKDSTGN
jgi:PQQ-dependent catabolism-associated CXXCW motif protein